MGTAEIRPRIALIHALRDSIEPAHSAFARLWPSAFAYDVLDTSLAVDRADVGRIDAEMIQRFRTLADYAARGKGRGCPTSGILFTCSAFGAAIEAVKKALPIPVLTPNEAAFEKALSHGDRFGLVVSFEPSEMSLRQELEGMAAARGRKILVMTAVAHGALDALKRGDGAAHDTAVANAAGAFKDMDAIILGQFSMARARESVVSASRAMVITTPESAVAALKARVECA